MAHPVQDFRIRMRKERRRRARLRRARCDSWWLAGKLGYHWNPQAGNYGKGLTEAVHRPICWWYDALIKDPLAALWMKRAGHKTTLFVIWIVQQFLIDPWQSMMYFHAVEDLAAGVVDEVGHLLQRNRFLRSLEPIGPNYAGEDASLNILPHPLQKKFVANQQFTLKRPDWCYNRFPSFHGKGAGSEVTGMHGHKAWLDDVLGKKDLEENTFAKKKSWYQHTLFPVVDHKWVRGIGTPWADATMYQDWMQSDRWYTVVLPASSREAYVGIGEGEDYGHLDLSERLMPEGRRSRPEQNIHLEPARKRQDGVKVYDLNFPIYGNPSDRSDVVHELEFDQDEMKAQFAPQMMCDPSPTGAKPWGEVDSRSLMIGDQPTKDGSVPGLHEGGTYVVLTDPAPKDVGSSDFTAAKARADGTKDYWTIAVFLLRWRGNRLERILVDGIASRFWNIAEGFDRWAGMMVSYGTNLGFYEDYGMGGNLRREARQSCIRSNAHWFAMSDADPEKVKEAKLAGNRTGEKNLRFADLASAALIRTVWVYYEERHSTEEYKRFLWGPGGCWDSMEARGSKHECFFSQAEGWRPEAPQVNGLMYDDHADIAARIMDGRFEKYAKRIRSKLGAPTWRDHIRAERRTSRQSRVRYLNV